MIYASELEVIERHVADSPRIETGGELAGLWTHDGSPVVLFAGFPGPKAQRTETFFEQDLDHHLDLQRRLWEQYRVQILGLWHSHHQLGLRELSSGDARRTSNYAQRHGRAKYCEILATLERTGGRAGLTADFHPYVYENAASGRAVPSALMILPGTSPIRAALGEAESASAGGWLSNTVHSLFRGGREREDAENAEPSAEAPGVAVERPTPASANPAPTGGVLPDAGAVPTAGASPAPEALAGYASVPAPRSLPAPAPTAPSISPIEAMFLDLEECVGKYVPTSAVPGLLLRPAEHSVEIELTSISRHRRFTAILRETIAADKWRVAIVYQEVGKKARTEEREAILRTSDERANYLRELLANGLQLTAPRRRG